MEVIKYDGTNNLRDVLEKRDAGAKLVCFRCGEELMVVLSPEELAEHKTHPGIYCRKGHVRSMIELRRPNNEFWDQFKK